jgi:hypothetical protein
MISPFFQGKGRQFFEIKLEFPTKNRQIAGGEKINKRNACQWGRLPQWQKPN